MNGRALPALWLGLVVGIVFWYLDFRYLRYLLPAGAVAVLLIALSSGTRRPGRRLEIAGLAGLAATAILLWPSVLSQYWNVPGRGIPWRAAFGRIGDNDYERQATVDRDLIRAFDAVAPPGALAASDPHERAWLTGDRDLTPFWEIHARLTLDHPAPEAPAATLAAVRAAGVSWFITWKYNSLAAQIPYLQRMLDTYGVPVWSTPGGTVYRLPDPEEVETPVGPPNRRAG